MKIGKQGTVLTVIFGLLAIITSVSLDEATNNASSYIERFGPYLFWIGWLAIIGAMVRRIRIYMRRIDAILDTCRASGAMPAMDHWAKRKQLEISVLANVSADREPTDVPIDKDPENSRFRELKDAIDTGELDSDLRGDCANFMSTVTFDDFKQYAATPNKDHWAGVLDRWQAVQSPPESKRDELVEKRIPLLRFLELAKSHGWDVLQAHGYDGFDLIHGISEAACLGDITVLGKKIDTVVREFTYDRRRQAILAEFWQTHAIEPQSCLNILPGGMVGGFVKSNRETHTTRDQGNALESEDYADLYLETDGSLDWLEKDAKQYRGHHRGLFDN